MNPISFKGFYIINGGLNEAQDSLTSIVKTNKEKQVPTYFEINLKVRERKPEVKAYVATGREDIAEFRKAHEELLGVERDCRAKLPRNPSMKDNDKLSKCLNKAEKWKAFTLKHSFLDKIFSADLINNLLKKDKFDTVTGEIIE